MCLHGAYKMVKIINENQGKSEVVIDACIADEIQELNNLGIITVGCCCGHGMSGHITDWENGFGKWKGIQAPPNTLIDEVSVELAKSLGYRPYPYYYSDGSQNGVWQMNLISGCITIDECAQWHEVNNVPYIEGVGVIGEKEESSAPL